MLNDSARPSRTKLEALSKKRLVELLMQEAESREGAEQASSTSASTSAHASNACLRCFELEFDKQCIGESLSDIETSRSAYVEMFEHAPIAYCTLDSAGSVTRANRLARRLASPKQDMVGFRLSSFLARSDRLTFEQWLRSHPPASDCWVLEGMQFVGSSHSLCIDLIVTRESPDEADADGYRVILVDVSKRASIEREQMLLSEASRVLASSLDYERNISAALATYTGCLPSLCFVDIKSEGGPPIRLFARSDTDDGAQRSIADELYPLGHRCSPQLQVLATGMPLLSAQSELRSAGDDVQSQSHSTAIIPLSANKKVLGCLTIVRDAKGAANSHVQLQSAFAIAPRIAMAVYTGQMHRDAQAAVRERQVVLGTVSHDIKNVMTAVALRSEVLASMPDARVAKAGDAIGRLASRIDRMLEDLLDVASIDRGQLSLRPIEHDSQRVLEEAVGISAALAEAKSIKIRIEPGPGRLIFCDAERTLQLLCNLMSNAIKFSEHRSTITVQQRPSGAEVVFSVQDEGPGIATDTLPLVFDSFWRAPDQRVQGRGLGLAICRGIADSSGGRIWAESTLGRGSTFYFTMPTAEKAAPTKLSRRRVEILLVDDDEDVRASTRDVLEMAGYEIATACNGREALDMVRGGCQPSLVVLDLNMPVLDGWGFLKERASSAALKELSVLVVSGEGCAEKGVSQLNAGFLRKPISAPSLLSTVRGQLEGSLMPCR